MLCNCSVENEKVLLCGHKSFVASGMTKTFDRVGITYDCFHVEKIKEKRMW